jgi:hypothetical protein
MPTHHALVTGSDNLYSDWLLDSAASSHLCCQKQYFTSMTLLTQPVIIATATPGKPIRATHSGDVKLSTVDSKGYPRVLTVSGVLYTPNAHRNLLSLSKLMKKGVRIRLTPGAMYLKHQNTEVGYAKEVNDLYII